MTDVPLWAVTWTDKRAGKVNVEVLADAGVARERCRVLALAGVDAKLTRQGIEVFWPVDVLDVLDCYVREPVVAEVEPPAPLGPQPGDMVVGASEQCEVVADLGDGLLEVLRPDGGGGWVSDVAWADEVTEC